MEDKVQSGEIFCLLILYSKTEQVSKTVEELVVWKTRSQTGSLIKGEKCPISGFWFWENIAKCGCRGGEKEDEEDDYDDYDDYEDFDEDDDYDEDEDYEMYGEYQNSDYNDNDYSFDKQKDFLLKNKMYNDVFIL